jgi:excisionase family DNA binding protein
LEIIGRLVKKDGNMKKKMKENLLTINEITTILKVSKLTIYRYIKSGKLPAYKVGRDYRVKQEDFDKLLENGKTKNG